ncbi:hypothetical protein HPL003_25650 [Paenibacillus terrae HPL-003]|uniref:Uncharacterized protein n=1 Tax=Paenibacillus terrae (strain HPL-003) TaxID=985665 RepID=G7VQD6_PAETH|nr:hypothetical protein [Paenibacillus terrae]AET61846.1 hypothetical protein HPL003_25650 [Paenibacillus terrae HPL-003]
MSGHFRKKALGFVLLMGAGVLLGMQLAGSGLRSVYGPEWAGEPVQNRIQQKVGYEQTVIEDTPAADVRTYTRTYNGNGNVVMESGTGAVASEANATERSKAQTTGENRQWFSAAPDANSQGLETPRELLAVKAEQTSVDTMADKTAGLLQNLSRQGIRWVVSVFDGVTE